MSAAPPRPCPAPHCGRPVVGGGRCARHQRPNARTRGYRSPWDAYAADWLRRFPWCGQRDGGAFSPDDSACVRRELRVLAAVVDHIRPLVRGGALLDPANHQSLCRSCNARKGGH